MTAGTDHLDGTNGSLGHPVAENGLANPGEFYTIPARQGRAVRLAQGQTLEIINPHGHQVCDFFALVDGSFDEVLSVEHCRTNLDRVYVRQGDVFVTNRRRPILQLVADTSPGVHDILVACCDQPRYEQLGVDEYHDNCADNFKMGLLSIGVDPVRVPSPLNIWMNIPVDRKGSFTWEAPVAKAGDYVRLQALLDCVAVMSACPQDITPVNGENTTPSELTFRILTS
ncbi:MAG: urea carboxylase-associated family protein [Rhizobiaceae bacterium]